MSEREDFLQAALAAGCPEDQVRNFILARVFLQPRQLAASAAARLCDRADGPTSIGYGGARGGGKSHWLLAQMGCDDCQQEADFGGDRVGKQCRGIVIRVDQEAIPWLRRK